MKFKAEELSYITAQLAYHLRRLEDKEQQVRDLMSMATCNEVPQIAKERFLKWLDFKDMEKEKMTSVELSIFDKLSKG